MSLYVCPYMCVLIALPPPIVIIDKVEEMSTVRRLLTQGIRIVVSLKALDKIAADAITTNLTQEGINRKLEEVGLPSATLLVAAAVVDDTQSNVNGTQIAALEVEASSLMGPGATLGVTLSVSIVFTGVATWIVWDLPPIRDKAARTLYLLDLLDTIFDWVHGQGQILRVILNFQMTKTEL